MKKIYIIQLFLILGATQSMKAQCESGLAAASATNYNNLDGGLPQYCAGAAVDFSALGSMAPVGDIIVDYDWDFGNGELLTTAMISASSTYNEGDIFTIFLTVNTQLGCALHDTLLIAVNTLAEFVVTDSMIVCSGTPISLVGSVAGQAMSNTPSYTNTGTGQIPDNGSHSSSILITPFPGIVIENCNEIGSFMINMEHSFMNDIIVEIECPNGTTVALLQQTGGGNWLGEPIDNENGTQGIGYEYFWSPDATITLGEFANLNGDTPSGEYLAEGDLCDLVGCPVNGNWIFHFQDVVGSDDGFVFQTAINFNISVSQYIAYTQTFGVDADSTYWTGPGILDTDPDMDIVSIDTAIPGSFDYTYIALGSSGCQYEAYTNITVVGIPDAPVITLNGNVLSSTIAPSYQWYLNGNLLNGATSMTYNPTQSGSYIVAVSDVLGCNTFFSNVIVYTIIDVSEIENENQFQAFPNPFNQSITLQHLDQDGRKCNKVQIVDLLGKTQFEKSITIANSSLTISTEHFSSGIYFVRLFSDNQVLRVEKIVKSN